jgi:hypothetical protein
MSKSLKYCFGVFVENKFTFIRYHICLINWFYFNRLVAIYDLINAVRFPMCVRTGACRCSDDWPSVTHIGLVKHSRRTHKAAAQWSSPSVCTLACVCSGARRRRDEQVERTLLVYFRVLRFDAFSFRRWLCACAQRLSRPVIKRAGSRHVGRNGNYLSFRYDSRPGRRGHFVSQSVCSLFVNELRQIRGQSGHERGSGWRCVVCVCAGWVGEGKQDSQGCTWG